MSDDTNSKYRQTYEIARGPNATGHDDQAVAAQQFDEVQVERIDHLTQETETVIERRRKVDAPDGEMPIATVERIDGAPMVRGVDGLIHGDELKEE